MSALGSKLRLLEGGGIMFFCPGCNENHVIYVEPAADGRSRPLWEFNGNGDAPTFAPSVLVRSGHYVDGNTAKCWCNFTERFPDAEKAPFHCRVCHSFVTDGQIQFLGDCTHALAGQTVPLPDFPEVNE
jgi:hypothetical protein